jgi:hypothetical protein
MPSGSQINYEALAQDAMRGLVRTVLKNIESDGLPGEHHFYIAFDTQADGVDLSKRINEQYPQEMTIVLQHRFWDLAVRDEDFEVKLTFNGIPERLCVPFSAIKVFFDPSVPYGLQFEAPGSADDEAAHDSAGKTDGGVRATLSEVPAVPVPDSDSEDSSGPGRRAPASVPTVGAARKKPKVAKTPAEPADGKSDSDADEAATSDAKPLAAHDDPATDAPEAGADDAAANDEATPPGAEVVQLDAFRKKT